MGVESGIIPYQYDGPIPLIIRPDMDPIGLSGILFEQAHFVLAAEIRRWSQRFAPTGDDPIFKYINKPAGITDASEASGCPPHFLTHPPSYPGGSNYTNQITDMRDMFESLMIDIFLDSDWSLSVLREDWLNNACPNPSGANGDYASREPGATEVDGLGRLLVLAPQESILGGSGTLFDIDLCEMRYQPYPRFVSTQFLNAHNAETPIGTFTGPEFGILARPIWPCFQKTDGTIIGLNARDTALTFSVAGRVLPFHDDSFFDADGRGLDSVGSGYTMLDGDAFIGANTSYLAASSGGLFSNNLTFTVQGARKLGKAEDGTNGYGRAFVTRPALAEGVYMIGAENRHANVPYTAFPSGFVSKWPTPQALEANAYTRPSIEKEAYSVFNEAFWMLDGGTASNGPSSRPPSGLAVIDPFTGNAVWLRYADLHETDRGSLPGFAQYWPDHVGLELVGGSVWRATESSFDIAGTDYFALIEYNTDLEFVAEHTFTFPAITSFGQLRDMMYDADNDLWFFFETLLSGPEVIELDGSFNFNATYEGGFSPIISAARINGEYWALSRGGLPAQHIQRFTLTAPTPPSTNGNVNYHETKIIQTETIPGLSGAMSTAVGVEDVQIISGASTVTDGIWMLVGGAAGAWMLRVIEDTTAFYAVEAIHIKTGDMGRAGDDFIYMAI